MKARTPAPVSAIALLSLALSAIASPQEAVLAAEVDCRGRGVKEQKYLYYAVLSHLPAAQRQHWWQMISAHVNGTSRRAEIVRPAVLLRPKAPGSPIEEADGLFIKPEDWDRAILIRINSYYYGWRKEDVEKLRFVEPHFHYREKQQQLARVDTETGEVKKVEGAKGADAAKVFVFRQGFREVPRSDVQRGEEFYEKVSANGYRKLGVGTGDTALEKRRDAADGNADLPAVLHGAWLPPAITSLASLTGSETPIFLADWFWWQTSIQAERAPGPGYADLLGFKDQDEFQLRVGFDPKTFRAKFEEFVREYRAAVNRSGVSKQPRRVSVENTLGGRIWITFDSGVAIGNKNPLEVPDDALKFDATEQLANLPNGILAMGLFNAAGVRQDFAPVEAVGGDRTSTDNDVRIHNGQCFRCHSEGIKPLKDWYRGLFTKGLEVGSPDYEAALDLQRKYSGKLNRQIAPTVALHAEAIKDACGLSLKEYSALITDCWKYVESDGVDLVRASRELGCDEKTLQSAWRAWKRKEPGKIAPRGIHTVDMFLKDEQDQEPITNRAFWDSITDLHRALTAYTSKGKP